MHSKGRGASYIFNVCFEYSLTVMLDHALYDLHNITCMASQHLVYPCLLTFDHVDPIPNAYSCVDCHVTRYNHYDWLALMHHTLEILLLL
jgi:hypothetical protein